MADASTARRMAALAVSAGLSLREPTPVAIGSDPPLLFVRADGSDAAWLSFARQASTERGVRSVHCLAIEEARRTEAVFSFVGGVLSKRRVQRFRRGTPRRQLLPPTAPVAGPAIHTQGPIADLAAALVIPPGPPVA